MKNINSSKPKQSTLTFSGGLTINNIDLIKKGIINKISVSDVTSIHFNKVSQIDLSGIQIIEALRKKIVKDGKICKIEVDIEPEYLKILERTGFKSFINSISIINTNKYSEVEVS